MNKELEEALQVLYEESEHDVLNMELDYEGYCKFMERNTSAKSIIEEAFEQQEQEHRLLQIIKTRELSVYKFRTNIKDSYDYEDYRDLALGVLMSISSTSLAEEEFNLIKEWLDED